MKHLGDICKISGYEAPVVDMIVGGSPCQDLSIAGARKGMKHSALGDEETTRSGLFMEQIRIVKEMRERERSAGRSDGLIRPRYLLWENVVGAFSSGTPKGADFAAVLEEIIKVAETSACVCVCVSRTEDGQNPGVTTLKMEVGVLPGVPTMLSSSAYLNGGEGLLSWPISMDSPPRPFYLTMNIGEKPREPNPTRLSEILEDNPDPKYSLTAKACEGILRRAERRGKPLPAELKEALMIQAGQSMTAPSVSKETGSTEPTPPVATDADGGGGAYTLNTIDRPAVYAENQGGA